MDELMADDDILAEEKQAFDEASDAEGEYNRPNALDDLRFARLGEQWPEKIRKAREDDLRPCLTNNLMPSFIRQVVNDSRQNKPQIKVKPVDSASDPATAQVMGGIIRNIETQSKSDIAYDTAIDFAASMGWGYLRVAVEYEYDDSFNKALRIKQVPNPFAVYGDPNSTEADSSDWDRAFVTELLSEDKFKAQYKGADQVSWNADDYKLDAPWRQDDSILVCESWKREKVDRNILMLSNGQVVGEKEYEANKDAWEMQGIFPTNSRPTKSFKVTQRIMTGAEVLETNEWAGIYIPIIPVYGEIVNVEGKRHFRSLIRDAKDAQRQANYWDTNATELVALAPRVPYLGEEGAFDVDPNWFTANSKSHPFLMYKKGMQLPQRQPLDSGVAAGSIAEAARSTDKMKAIMGLYDASLGQKSNETSGVAITARQREGDVSTFHIHDNLSRAIRHTGCILVDLIPKVYTGEMVMRLMGEDDKERTVNIGKRPEGQPAMPPEPSDEQIMRGEKTDQQHIYDLGLGKYDVVIDTGPSVTTQREETAEQMMELLKAFPQAAPLIGDLLVKNLNWAQSDEIAKRLKAMLPAQAAGGLPPEVDQMIQDGMKQIQELGQKVQMLEQKVGAAAAEKMLTNEMHKIELAKKDLKIQELTAEKQLNGMVQQNNDNIRNAKEEQRDAEATKPKETSAPVQINIPDNIGEVISQAVVQGLAQLPALNVNMPPPTKMKRTPVRDKQGLILHTIDEPIQEMMN